MTSAWCARVSIPAYLVLNEVVVDRGPTSYITKIEVRLKHLTIVGASASCTDTVR